MEDIIYLQSSSIEWVRYIQDSSEMHIAFLDSGAIYSYFDVSPEVFEQFMNSSSKGRFFNSEIKPVYQFARL